MKAITRRIISHLIYFLMSAIITVYLRHHHHMLKIQVNNGNMILSVILCTTSLSQTPNVGIKNTIYQLLFMVNYANIFR